MSIAVLASDYPVVAVPPGQKGPARKNWQDHPLTPDEATAHIDRGGNVGLLIGPTSGLIDIEADGENADDTLHELFDGKPPHTPSHASTRGRHLWFKWDERLANLGPWPKHGGLEFRLGNGKACQSLIPPSQVDGVVRRWIVDLADNEPAALPDSAIAKILEWCTPKPKRREITANREAQDHSVELLSAYLRRAGAQFSLRHGDQGQIFLDLEYCPLRGPDHTDGKPALIIYPDGAFVFFCFHSKCACKKFADLEAVFGRLRPLISLGPDEDRVTLAVIHAVATSPRVYERGTLWVEICRDTAPPTQSTRRRGAARIRQLPRSSLAEVSSSVADYQKWSQSKKDFVPCRLPDSIIKMIEDRADKPGVAPLEGLISSPAMLPDGSILTEPGYHRGSGLYLDTSEAWPALMPVQAAIAIIDDAICDFPFAEPTHRSAMFAAMLSVPARNAYSGSTPFIAIDSNTRGCGKGLVTDLISVIAEGRRASLTSAPTDEGEWRKLLTSVAIAAPTIAVLDNLKGKLQSPSLEQAITGGSWRDRVLGGNQVIDVPLPTIWLSTANNCELSPDMARRTLNIRLETPLEKPEERTGFRHPDLIGWAIGERPRLVMACLSILRGYHDAGRPDQHLTPWGSFAGWSDLVRSAVVWSGLPDPAATRATLAEHADDETAQLRDLMAGWSELPQAMTVAKAMELVQSDESKFAKLRAAVADLRGDVNRQLGTILRGARGRVLDGRRFVGTGTGTKKWSVQSV